MSTLYNVNIETRFVISFFVKVLFLRSVEYAMSAARRRTSEPGVSVKYTPCSKEEHSEDDLEEIAIVDRDDNKSVTHSNDKSQKKMSMSHLAANGPKHLPGLGIFQAFTSSRDRNKAVGERLSTSGGRISVSSPVYSSKIVEQKSKSTSKQSLLDFFGTKIDRRKSRKSISTRSEFGLSLIRKGRSSEVITPSQLRKQRRKEIEENFGKKSRRNDRFEATTTTTDRDGCNWTFVFDPAGRLSYWWSSVVSIAFLYNFWVIIYRFAFQEINSENLDIWFPLDYTADLLYILDIAFHFRTGYLEDGVLQTDSVKLRIHYMNTTLFYIDCLCLLPLVKVYRFWAFLDRTERHTNYPNLIRTMTLMHYLLALFHWNACLYYLVAKSLQESSSTWKLPKDDKNVFQQYLHGLYWSTLTLTTIGNLPTPRTSRDYLFIIAEMIFGLLLFATVLGHISNIVASISNARKDFQAKLDGVKTYMSLRRVPMRLQDRVIKWFDYLWYCNKSADEEKTLGLLPDKLKAEIAIHVHLDTLKRVEIFQNTEAGFLCELVLRLKPVLFSPGDYICRKESSSCLILDGQARVLSIGNPTHVKTFRDLADVFVNLVYQSGAKFKYRQESIKQTTRQRRTKTVKPIRHVVETDLARFLSEELLIHAPSEKEIVVAGGFDNEQEVRSSVLTRDLSELSASHEEADTRIILQAIDAQTSSVVVCAMDIDVFILLVAHLSEIKSDHVWMMTGISTKRRYIPIKDVFQRIPPHSIDSLLAFHSLTGCDTTSFFYGHS
ncbi:hypothetical protein KUTeg_011547 [Tegillarca granosa]|uniref:Ion transport domain-containing protein n=1 Tax=Tegillarca granosa TaxID=220873 RepID=A0ABQ9EWZ6_TEGGR|nr:hypothetical protein KUTeg_011547 [Tegillarca granosa]